MMKGRKLLVGFLTAVMVVSGPIALAMTTNAETTPIYGENGQYEDKIQYMPMTDELKSALENKKAPTMAGYVFGGWCTQNTDGETYTVLSDVANANSDDVYAKFVPAYVLSIKAQVDTTTYQEGAEREEAGSIRLVSSVDSKDYQKVGFKILLNNSIELTHDDKTTEEVETNPLETTTIYTGLKTSQDAENAVKADKLFGSQSKYLSVWRLDGILADNDTKIINVTPYWITMDGTKVMGITKYVHMEDGYNGYISIPIKLNGDTAIAGGTLTFTYPAGLELVEDKIELDGMFSSAKMRYYVDTTNHTITFVGNAATVGEDVSPDGIYANLRFQAGSSGYESGSGSFINFFVSQETFCNWNEDIVTDVVACDIQY